MYYSSTTGGTRVCLLSFFVHAKTATALRYCFTYLNLGTWHKIIFVYSVIDLYNTSSEER